MYLHTENISLKHDLNRNVSAVQTFILLGQSCSRVDIFSMYLLMSDIRDKIIQLVEHLHRKQNSGLSFVSGIFYVYFLFYMYLTS